LSDERDLDAVTRWGSRIGSDLGPQDAGPAITKPLSRHCCLSGFGNLQRDAGAGRRYLA
jgi:hypothetical protein